MSGHERWQRRWLVASILCASLVLRLSGVRAAEESPPLTSAQEHEVTQLCRQLISPCCWTTSVADHGTGMAPLIRDTVRTMVAEGASDQAILDHFVASFGERILAEPKQRGFNRVAYWMPVVAVLLGAGLIVRFVRRRDLPPAAPPTPPASNDPYRARVAEELRRLEG